MCEALGNAAGGLPLTTTLWVMHASIHCHMLYRYLPEPVEGCHKVAKSECPCLMCSKILTFLKQERFTS